jgi:hypothetical protein
MSGDSGYYCVIQYCPDRGREESANLGVLLYAPASQRVQAKVGVLSSRARQFFGLNVEQAATPNSAAAALAHLVNSGAASIDSLDALQSFVATRANDIRLTAPRLAKVTNFTGDLEELYRDLVEAAQSESNAPSRMPQLIVPPRLHEVFTKLTLQGRVTTPGKVRVPLSDRELDIPYAYQNGVLNLVKPQILSDGRKGENRALYLAAEGELLQKHPENGERRLIVVAGPGSVPAAESYAARLLNDFGVKFVPQEQADRFAQEVEEQAH